MLVGLMTFMLVGLMQGWLTFMLVSVKSSSQAFIIEIGPDFFSVSEIRCNECNESFSTRAIKHLHTCNSILDKLTMAVSGDHRKTKQTTYFDNDDQSGKI